MECRGDKLGEGAEGKRSALMLNGEKNIPSALNAAALAWQRHTVRFALQRSCWAGAAAGRPVQQVVCFPADGLFKNTNVDISSGDVEPATCCFSP